MHWEKQGRVMVPGAIGSWSQSHIQLPITVLGDAEADDVKVIFSTRDQHNITRGARAVMTPNGSTWKAQFDANPVLEPGAPGTFDDMGAMPTSAIRVDGVLYLYYIGWNVRNTVPYHNAIGLALYDESAARFQKIGPGPLFDRSVHEPYFSGTACVLFEEGLWRMWYLSCTEWRKVEGKMEPRYLIRYAESHNGIDWRREGKISIAYKHENEAIASASVFRLDDGTYCMMYSYRDIQDYRQGSGGYRMGYAISKDGYDWERIDGQVWSAETQQESWDAEMQAYPHVFKRKGQWMMLYNGNGFGQTGVGLAKAHF
jgi:hypothetical protein